MTSIAIDPATASIVFVTTAYDGVFKSSNGGDTWVPSSTGLPSGGTGHIAIDPTAPSTLYVSASNPRQVFRSTDGGATWAYYDLTTYAQIQAIAVDANGTVYVSSLYGYWLEKRSRNGTSWSVTTSTSDPTINAIAIDPTNTSKIFVGTGSSGVLVSTNGGSSWTAMNPGLTELNVLRLVLNPSGTAIYAGAGGGGVFDFEVP